MAFNYKEEYQRYKRYYQSLAPAPPVRRAYTAIIFSFLVISLFAWYAIRPTIQTIVTLKREIVDKTDIDKKMEDKISMLIEAQAAYQQIEPDLPIMDQALPTNPEALRAAQELQFLASDMNVSITNMSVSAVPITDTAGSGGKPNPTPNTVLNFPLSLSVTGTYTDIKNFIQGIDNLRRLMQIDSMLFTPIRTAESIASESATPTGTNIKLDLKLIIFYLSP